MSAGPRMGARRARRIVMTVCVVFTAGLALFALLNVYAAYRYPRDSRAVLEGHPVFNEAKRPVYERIYRLPIAAVREIIAESYMENAWVYEPYVQFRERPREGRFVNVSPDGFRLNRAGDRRAFEPAAPAVFLLGGSTTFGYGVRDEDTIAAHLEALLRERLPSAPLVAVYNFGRGYYGSSQEMLLLKSLVQRGMVPRVAVFIDGVNEFALCPTYSANVAEVFKILQQDPAAKLREVIGSLPITRLVGSSGRSALAGNRMYHHRALEGYAFECRCVVPDGCYPQIVKTYRLNKQLVRTVAQEFGFEARFVLQPVGGYRNRFTMSPDGTPRPDCAAQCAGYERDTLGGPHDHSLTGVLEHFTGEPFVDSVHYTSEASRLIAERLLPIVLPALASSPPPAAPAPVEAEIVVAAEPAVAFSFFTDSAKVGQWLGQPARVRAQRGGEFEVRVKDDTWVRAMVAEIEAPGRLALDWSWEVGQAAGISRLVISFTRLDRGTRVRVVHAGLPPALAPLYRDGWTHFLARLASVVAGKPSDGPAQSQK